QHFGSSTIIGAIDVAKTWHSTYKVYDHTTGKALNLNPVEHALSLQAAGAGEIFINCVYKDGTYSGFDTGLIKKMNDSVDVPVIACGGASSFEEFTEVT